LQAVTKGAIVQYDQ